MIETDSATEISDLAQVIGLDAKVPVLNGALRKFINLDNAASTPVLTNVQRGIERFMDWYSSIHRGAGFKSRLASWAYDEARVRITRFLGGDPGERVTIFGRNSTDALNKLACRYPFKDGDVLLTTIMEHHSNDLPWRQHVRIERVGCEANGSLDLNQMEDKLKEYSGKIPLVAVTGASNVSGIINPIYEIAELVHRYGAELCVDAAQLAPHRGIDIGKRGEPRSLDYIAISGHKMYAPYGSGVLIGWPGVFVQGTPEYSGGGTVKLVTHDEVLWRDPPHRDEAGSPNVVGVVALALATQFLQKISMEELAAHENELTRQLLLGLQHLSDVKLYGTENPDPDFRLGVVPFNIMGVPHGKTAAILACEYAIGVRSGCFCAHPYVQELLDFPKDEQERFYSRILHGEPIELPGLVRISFGLYNTVSEVDMALQAIEDICNQKYSGTYHLDPQDGGYWAEDYSPDYEKFFSFADSAF